MPLTPAPSRYDFEFLEEGQPGPRLSSLRSARMHPVKRRTLLQSIPAAAFLPASLWAASQQSASPAQAVTGVYELRVYHASPGKLADLLARFRDHTVKLFDRHGMKSLAYWTPVDEPDKSNTLIYILYHPSRDAAAANWKSFQDDPEWKSVHDKSEANGKLVDKVDSTFMALTDFSPTL
jgi:NIPSNAP